MNEKITVMNFTLNEERRLPYLYDNLRSFCSIVVFDGGSTDGTIAFCQRNNIKYLSRPRQSDGNVLIPADFQWAYEQVSTDYVMHVYCAHVYPRALLESFSKAANMNRIRAVYHDVVIVRYGVVVHRPMVERVSSA